MLFKLNLLNAWNIFIGLLRLSDYWFINDREICLFYCLHTRCSSYIYSCIYVKRNSIDLNWYTDIVKWVYLYQNCFYYSLNRDFSIVLKIILIIISTSFVKKNPKYFVHRKTITNNRRSHTYNKEKQHKLKGQKKN